MNDLAARTALSSAAALYNRVLKSRLGSFRSEQLSLRDRFRVHDTEPTGYTEGTRDRIRSMARADTQSRLLLTAGSTAQPKELFYPLRRIEEFQSEFLRQMVTMSRALPLRSSRLYFLTSLTPSSSLSSALHRPPRLSAIERVALSRSLVFEPYAERAAREVDELWVHVAYTLLVSPSVIVATNPSSILMLVEQAIARWGEGREHVLRILPIVWNNASPYRRSGFGGEAALERAMVTASQTRPFADSLFPNLEAVVCWTGDSVGPYVERLVSLWPNKGLVVVPMIPLSTEAVLGLSYPNVNGFLPLYPDTLYEFRKAGAESGPLLAPWELSVGERYSMIVSDSFGLQRYDTEDVFECVGTKQDAPTLEFVGRAGSSESPVGEQ